MGKVKELLEERAKTHGTYTHTAFLSQKFKEVARKGNNWDGGRLNSAQQESIDMILHKIARILSGDPDHIDSWQDISGYAQLVVDELEHTEKLPF